MGPLARDSSPGVSQDVGQGSGLLGKLTLVVVGGIHFPAGHATWASCEAAHNRASAGSRQLSKLA